MSCPKMYFNKYIEGLHPAGTSAALAFGSFVDGKLNELFGGEPVTLDFNKLALEPGDLRIDWIPAKQFPIIEEKARGLGWEGDNIKSTLEVLSKRRMETFSLKQMTLVWMALRASYESRTSAIVSSYNTHVKPRLGAIGSSQKHITVSMNGTEVVAVVDLIAELDGVMTVIDHKTSARAYAKDAAAVSPQLALYAALLGISRVAYVVFRKDTVKCVPQVLVADVDPDFQRQVQDALKFTRLAIDSGSFPMNLKSCQKHYGKPCVYKAYCLNGSKVGLEQA